MFSTSNVEIDATASSGRAVAVALFPETRQLHRLVVAAHPRQGLKIILLLLID
jgi:hypothetical protein